MMLENQLRFAVVIPAFNESGTIRDVVTRTLRQVERVIVVDDGSNDGTAAALEDLPGCLCAVRLQYPVVGIAKDLASYIADKALIFNDKNGRADLASLIHLGCRATHEASLCIP